MPKIGFQHTNESKEKMRLAHLGKIPWSKGKKFSKAYRKKLSKARKGRFCGSEHPNWKGGEIITRGYIYIHSPDHPFCECKGYVKRARLVMERMLGRYLEPIEQVHHKGVHFPLGSLENKQDDSPENLKLFSDNSGHLKFHSFKRKRNKLGQFA